MKYQIVFVGESPLIMHSAAGLDARLPVNRAIQEIARKKASNRTESDEDELRRLECEKSFWLDGDPARPAVPPPVVRAVIESAARKLRQGPAVRGGMTVQKTVFSFDEERYGTSMGEWRENCQFTVPVVVQRNRVLRTRALFEPPWQVAALIHANLEHIDRDMLANWGRIAGDEIGIGDWRPEKSGHYGRFSVESLRMVD